ncbi:MAG: alpha/beta hydrolase [Clostridia bacterium]|nr:alpha/beta hydrolase [Clostridia bacterium]
MLHQWELTIPSLSPRLRRRAYVYLPQEYSAQPQQRYPVMYMFDGQNVFLDSHATFGTSWGMYDYMNRTKTPLIIAAVECNSVGNGRLREYSPFPHASGELGPIHPLGHAYMNWLVSSFKPMIDRKYRTLPDREHTLIAGSSMGGLMSLYAVSAYNHVFSRAACLSPSLWVNPDGVRRMIRRADYAEGTCIYMDYGRGEMGNHEASFAALSAASQALLARGTDLTFRIVPGGTHCEASWAKQVPAFMHCLGFSPA